MILKKISVVILFFVFSFSFLFFFDNFFKVKFIEIEKESYSNLIGLDKLINKNIFFLSEKKIADNLKLANPTIEEIFVKKKYPQTIFLSIKRGQPLALIKNNQSFLFVSSSGKILFRQKEKIMSNLPVINYYQSLTDNPGQKIDYNDILITLKLLERLDEKKRDIKTIDILGEDMILFNLVNDQQFIFSSRKEVEEQIYWVKIILKKFKIEGGNFKAIDVRFNKPIIKF